MNKGFKDFITSPGGTIVLIIVMYIVFFAIEFALLSFATSQESEILILIWWVLMGIFGWRILTGIQPEMFVIASMNAWIVYFIIKGVLAALIGIFVAPYVVSKLIIERIQ